MRKKCMVLLAICVLITSFLGFEMYFAENSILDSENMEILLEEYAAERETEFMSLQNTSLYQASSEKVTGRIEKLMDWKQELEIELEDVEVDCSVREILDETECELKVLAYEWVMIEYKCVGFEKKEVMGFGTDHILTFSKTRNGFVLSQDSYSEITGYTDGTEQDLTLLNKLVEEQEYTQEFEIEDRAIDALAVPIDSYNATAAVAYSEQWCGNTVEGTNGDFSSLNYNPLYYYYGGVDCCNFVSQCLENGGMTTDNLWYATKNYSGNLEADVNGSKTPSSWRYVPDFVNYWTGKGYVAKRITNASDAVYGNLIYYLKKDGYENNHIMIIVGTNSAGKVLTNGHTRNSYRYPITIGNSDNDKKYYMLDVAHDYKTVVFRSSMTHTLRCVHCTRTKAFPHVWVSNRGTRQCNVCGYVE